MNLHIQRILPFTLLPLLLLAEEPRQELITPSFYINAVGGTTSADDPASLAPGGHDPDRSEALQFQSIEPALSLRYGDHLAGFANLAIFNESTDDWDAEVEEAFLKLHSLPGGFEVRGGRYKNRFGFHNPTHLHSWATVDAPLPNALLLGEEGLVTEGGELNWYATDKLVFSASFGSRLAHDHGHGAEHDEDHEEHGDEHDDHGDGHEDEHDEHEEDHDDHGHGYDSHALEALQIDGDILTLSARHEWRRDDFFVLRSTLGWGDGENEAGEDAWLGQLGFEIEWRENGLEPGGRGVRWRNELIYADSKIGAHHEHEEQGEDHHEEHADHEEDEEHEEHAEHGDELASVDVLGWSSLLEVTLSEAASPFLRFDYVEEVANADLPSWERISLGCTLRVPNYPAFHLRPQVNIDNQGFGQEESFWVQLGYSFGGSEVR